MELKKMEGAIEAILFAMGEAVSVKDIAKTIGHDTETTRKIIRNMMLKYQTEDRGLRSLSWKTLSRCVQKRNITIIWWPWLCSQESGPFRRHAGNPVDHCL